MKYEVVVETARAGQGPFPDTWIGESLLRHPEFPDFRRGCTRAPIFGGAGAQPFLLEVGLIRQKPAKNG